MTSGSADEPIYATEGLVDVLLERAAGRAPEKETVSLSVTPAGELPDLDFPPETPVFTHFYLPTAGGSVSAVFGVDLGTPPGQTAGRFVSHPDGRFEPTQTDDFHVSLFVAVPPWTRDSIAVFDRDSTQRELALLDVEPPEDALES
ncbi:hypothetical protein [Halorhabdus rudnickae]|uniref:hypothetical protein n=1 Tax=Halorhabdus rudnickae TaxID=1775544 RepID=UPI001083807E|nr:hypothetical protein [Halorhabdus rudnickae]